MNQAKSIPTSSDRELVQSQVQAILDDWSATGQADTFAALDRYPHLRRDKSAVLDLVCEEIVVRVNAGETIDPIPFAERFPDYRHSILNLLECQQFVKDNAEILDHAPAFHWPSIGEKLLNTYTIVRQLGLGGFARVYVARHEEMDQLVVVKVSPPSPLEPKLLGQLNHPNVVTIQNAVTVPPLMTVIAMPFQGTATLIDLLDVAFRNRGTAAPSDGALGDAITRDAQPGDGAAASLATHQLPNGDYYCQIRRLATAMAEGLAHSHSKEICHRDLKPTNVILTWKGDPVIVDFNLAVDQKCNLNHAGGTLRYMAPEQLRSALSEEMGAKVGLRADIFSFGVIVYELLTGHHPFGMSDPCAPSLIKVSAKDRAEWLIGQHASGCLPPSRFAPRINQGLEHIVLKCLQFKPEDRPSAAELVGSLKQLVAPRAIVREWMRRRRKPIYSIVLAMVFCLLMGAYGLATRPTYRDRVLARIRTGLVSDNEDHHAQDLRDLGELARRNPNDALVHFYCGLIDLLNDDYGAADSEFGRALVHPSVENGRLDAIVHAALAFSLAKEGNSIPAFVHADEAIKAGFENAAILAIRCYTGMATGKMNEKSGVEQIVKDADKAVAMAPAAAVSYSIRARCQIRCAEIGDGVDHIAAALSDIDELLKLDSPDWEIRLRGAEQLIRRSKSTDDDDKALTWLGQAVQLGADADKIRKNLDSRFQKRPGYSRLDPSYRRRQSVDAHRPWLVNPVGDELP